MLDAGDLRHLRPAAGRDQDMLGGDRAGPDLEPVRADDGRVRLDDLDLRLAQHLDVDAVEPVELAVLGRDQLLPVELRAADVPAIAARVLELFVEMHAVDQQLLRDTAAQHAGAADAHRFRDGDARAIGRGATRRGDTAGAGADDEIVVVEFSHNLISLPEKPPQARTVHASLRPTSSVKA